MKLDEMYASVLTFVLIVVLIGIGLTVIGTFGDSVRTAATATDNNRILWTHNWTSLTNSNINSITSAYNSTDAYDATGYVELDKTGSYQSTAARLKSGTPSSLNGSRLNITYVYGVASGATTAMTNSVTAIDDFVTWIPVMIVIIAAAIIIGMVMRSMRS